MRVSILAPSIGLINLTAGASLPTFHPRMINTLTIHNPLFPGFYADPEIRVYDNTYWIFPTTSIAFEDQTYFDAFSSPDLETWTKHPNIFTASGWARDNFWAPTSFQGRDGRYYLFFSANGLRSQHDDAGLGVAVADRPEGPYKDALGQRLISTLINGGNPMDPDILQDTDGTLYFYFGGTTANVALLDPSTMLAFLPFPNNDDSSSSSSSSNSNTTFFKDITPAPTYVEGIKVFQRRGTYYMMWSENSYGDPTYQVAYGRASSPLGPFPREAVVLQQLAGVAVATGHNGVVNVPGTDEWWVVYHRRPVNETDANSRVVAMDRLEFDEEGRILQVVIT